MIKGSFAKKFIWMVSGEQVSLDSIEKIGFAFGCKSDEILDLISDEGNG